jgi:hypothetical protein
MCSARTCAGHNLRAHRRRGDRTCRRVSRRPTKRCGASPQRLLRPAYAATRLLRRLYMRNASSGTPQAAIWQQLEAERNDVSGHARAAPHGTPRWPRLDLPAAGCDVLRAAVSGAITDALRRGHACGRCARWHVCLCTTRRRLCCVAASTRSLHPCRISASAVSQHARSLHGQHLDLEDERGVGHDAPGREATRAIAGGTQARDASALRCASARVARGSGNARVVGGGGDARHLALRHVHDALVPGLDDRALANLELERGLPRVLGAPKGHRQVAVLAIAATRASGSAASARVRPRHGTVHTRATVAMRVRASGARATQRQGGSRRRGWDASGGRQRRRQAQSGVCSGTALKCGARGGRQGAAGRVGAPRAVHGHRLALGGLRARARAEDDCARQPRGGRRRRRTRQHERRASARARARPAGGDCSGPAHARTRTRAARALRRERKRARLVGSAARRMAVCARAAHPSRCPFAAAAAAQRRRRRGRRAASGARRAAAGGGGERRRASLRGAKEFLKIKGVRGAAAPASLASAWRGPRAQEAVLVTHRAVRGARASEGRVSTRFAPQSQPRS